MPRILLDEQPVAIDPTPSTWGELLGVLDAEFEARSLIVTDVRFDGLDEPAFREPDALGRQLAEMATVEVASGTAASLMERCLAEAAASIAPLCEAAVSVGEQFRGFDVGDANRGLSELAESLNSLMGIVGAASLALKVDLRQVMSEDRPVSQLTQELTTYLETTLEAQQSQDWITVADVLQYDLEPALKRWAPVFTAFSERTANAAADAGPSV